ncbi:MAG: twitching motility protein PilT [Nitrosopumilaceae archaeon]|nr:twitching motility protein PilT [Nitrosopumilaceae archaeon]
MPERLPDIICDTGFLMHMASGRIRNLDGFDLGNVSYVVPGAVLRELEKLSTDAAKGHEARKALGLAGAMRRIIPGGDYADRAILDHIRRHGGTVATTDAGLKRDIKAAGGGVVSLHDDNMVLESPSGGGGSGARRRTRR